AVHPARDSIPTGLGLRPVRRPRPDFGLVGGGFLSPISRNGALDSGESRHRFATVASPHSSYSRRLPMLPVEEPHWFDAEVRPCEPALRAYLQKRFPALSDHDDLVQEAYLRLLRARREGRVTSAKAFLFTVARNLAIDMFRRRRTAVHEPISDALEHSH